MISSNEEQESKRRRLLKNIVKLCDFSGEEKSFSLAAAHMIESSGMIVIDILNSIYNCI